MPQIFPQSLILMYMLFILSIFIFFSSLYPEKSMKFTSLFKKKEMCYKFLFKW